MGFLDYEGLTKFWDKVKALLSNKQNILSFGNGLSTKDDTVSVTTPVKSLTKAEYDALSEEEKNSGLYILPDANINLNDHGDVYSTEETRIGTWIDGKPIYRKVLDIPEFTVTTGESIVLPDNWLDINIDIIAFYGELTRSSDGTKIPIPGSYVLSTLNNKFNLLCLAMMGTCKGFACVEYTKTTDPTPASQTTLLTSQVPLPSEVTLDTSSTPITVTFPATSLTASASSASINFAPASASASSTSFTL